MKLRSLLLVLVLLVTACEKKAIAPPPAAPPARERPVERPVERSTERRVEPRFESRSEPRAETGTRPGTVHADILGNRSGAAPAPPQPAPTSAPRTLSLEDYSVTVAANETMEIPGPPGELRVWIGIDRLAPRAQPGMVTETVTLGNVGQTARIKPFALGIDVDPSESLCAKIAPSGSEVRFKLSPSKIGTFTVGATVALYDTPDCSGPPVPKSANSVTVKVVVNRAGQVREGASEMGSIAWRAFLDFWRELLALVFFAVLFLLRKRIRKWFGW